MLLRRLIGQFNFSRPKSRRDLFAKSVSPISVVAGLFGFRVPDITIQLISALFPLLLLFVTQEYISRVSVPEALAINYFKSFVQPMAQVMGTDNVAMDYDTDVAGGEPVRIPDLRKLNPRLMILMPKDLAIATTSKWLPEMPRTRGIIHAKNWLGEPRDYTIRLKPKHHNGFVIFDVPNNLTALRALQFEDGKGGKTFQAEKRAQRAEHALKQYSERLNDDLVEAGFSNVQIVSPENTAKPKE